MTREMPPERSDVPSSLRFEEMLGNKTLDRSLSKRERTRYLFMAIAARCIQQSPAQNPTVEFVLAQSGLARSTFYNHFKDVDDCVFEVLSLFFEYIEGSRVSSSRDLPTYDAILEANRWYCRAYEANANLFAAIHRNADLGKIRETRNSPCPSRVRTGTGRCRRDENGAGSRRIAALTICELPTRFRRGCRPVPARRSGGLRGPTR